jgi:hypothetical protein
MDYAKMYTLRATGKIISGRNAGRVLEGETMTLVEEQSQEQAAMRTERYKGVFVGTVVVGYRQFFDSRPETLPAGATWQDSLFEDGGFVSCDLQTLEIN